MVPLVLFLIIAASEVHAAPADSCRPCAIPCARPADTEFRVEDASGEVITKRVFVSAQRDTSVVNGRLRQSLRLTYLDGTVCRDTSIAISDIGALQLGLTLGKVPPVRVPVLPLREFERLQREDTKDSWLEIGPVLAYAGADESDTPQIGFDNMLFGAEVLVAPFGDLLGERLSLALGATALSEAGRWRLGPMGHLRFSFSSWTTQRRSSFVPNACAFSCDRTGDTLSPGPGFDQLYDLQRYDHRAYVAHETVNERGDFRPYLFVEGGMLFPTDFEGAGADPSINPDDYGEWFGGIGVGLPLWDVVSVSAQYRYLRLNLRTPCPDCDELYRVNTNNVHSVLLRIAYRLEW